MANQYVPPKVWTMDSENGGQWASINRPDSGARHEKTLPIGEHPIQLYSMGTPNGQKVTIMLEELLALGVKDAEYDAFLIRIGDGDQFGSGFVDVNPNSKIPAMVDRSGPEPINVFESGNILFYLAEKFGHLLPTEAAPRAQVMNWLFWLQGSAPYLGGALATSTRTRQRNLNIQSTALRWKPNVSWMCWINNWRKVPSLRAKRTALPISQFGLGMATWRWATRITRPSSLMFRATSMYNAGRK